MCAGSGDGGAVGWQSLAGGGGACPRPSPECQLSRQLGLETTWVACTGSGQHVDVAEAPGHQPALRVSLATRPQSAELGKKGPSRSQLLARGPNLSRCCWVLGFCGEPAHLRGHGDRI